MWLFINTKCYDLFTLGEPELHIFRGKEKQRNIEICFPERILQSF